MRCDTQMVALRKALNQPMPCGYEAGDCPNIVVYHEIDYTIHKGDKR